MIPAIVQPMTPDAFSRIVISIVAVSHFQLSDISLRFPGPKQLLQWAIVLGRCGQGCIRTGLPFAKTGRDSSGRSHLCGVRLVFVTKNLAERTGLEPATPGVTGRYSNQTELPLRSNTACGQACRGLGGCCGVRTCDLRLVRATLSQLS